MQNIKVIGIDNDKTAVESAKTNLKWFNFSDKDYKLINEDSSKIKIQNVDAIATEPDLGELQKKIPNEEKAKQIISSFEKLMVNVIKNLKKNVKGKIVLTSPLVKTKAKKNFS